MKSLIIFTSLLFIVTTKIVAQDQLRLEVKEDLKPDIYIDGKKYGYEIFDLLDQSKIESVNIMKGEQAMKEYNAPHGVVIIKSKKAAQQMLSIDDKEVKIIDNDKEPVIVINGTISTRESLSKLSPDDVESVEVLKGEKAMDQYNARNGVILVKTKK